ncbi:MAG: hypothetical protein L7W95_02410 [Alphaproteobacteria bacterium]|nr:hypothetical protein [Alphaproteobacteria bacterium]
MAASGLFLAACQTPLPPTPVASGTGTGALPASATEASKPQTTDTTSTGMATVDTAGNDGISDGEAAPAPAPVPTDRTAPMQAPVTKQSRKALPAQADDTTGDTAPDAAAGSATDMAAETLDDAFDIAAVTAPPPPVPAVEPPPPPPPEFEPASMLGASSSKIEAVLGSADLLRREGTAEVWQYRLATCVVDYFVYPDANGNKQVTGWDWRPPIIAKNLNAQQCRQDLAARQVTSDL